MWFKVDDGFYDHTKVENLSMAARGLWVTCGSWCGKQLTDGVISDRRVRQLGGTRTQIKALVDSGLWVAFVDESGAKCYRFHDWFDMNPSRESVHESREREREKKREWRDRKAAKQGKRENVPGGQDRGQDRGHFRPSPGVSPSTRPDPTRPDHKEGEAVSKGEVVRGAGFPSLDDLAEAHATAADAGRDTTPPVWSPSSVGLQACGTVDDPRCAEHAHLPRDQVPACHACAAARRLLEAQATAEREAHRAAIDACEMCDDRGLVDTTDTSGRPVAVKCDHTTPPAAPTGPQTAWQPTSDPNTRKALFNALKRHTGEPA